MITTINSAAPVGESERITILDSLRGFAILGILLMNMPGFSLPDSVGSDPSTMNEFGTINYTIWYFITWFMNGTQRALFSMLFGAGIILFIGRQENKVDGLQPADYFFRRQLWLIALSLFDVWILMWSGDILLDYACYGMMLFVFRKLPPRTLIIAACVCLLFQVARENRDLYERKSMISAGEAVAAIDTTQIKLTDAQKEKLDDLTSFKKRVTHESKLERRKKDMTVVQGSYGEVYHYWTEMYTSHLISYLYFEIWDVILFMLLGMALFKMGILTGKAKVSTYMWFTIVGLGVGLSLSYLRVKFVLDYNFNWFEFVKGVPLSLYNLDRSFRSVGILGLIMLLYKSGLFGWLFAMLRPVGQMALTNYLSQSLICAIIFYGIGFSLYGELQRYETYLVVLAIWIFQIIFCNIWMRFFLYGPCEWIWRSLTYWKPQAFVRSQRK